MSHPQLVVVGKAQEEESSDGRGQWHGTVSRRLLDHLAGGTGRRYRPGSPVWMVGPI
jgi:hypothetical protein